MVPEYTTKRSWTRGLVRTVQVLLVVIVLIIGIALVVLYSAAEIGGPVLYRLPGDYRGWVGIRYDDPACAPLRKEGWYLVIPIDSNGRACTSSSVPGGWRYVRYEYLYLDGRRRDLTGPNEQVWGIGATGPQAPRISMLFVGSEAERKRSWSRQHDFLREMKGKS